jgi:hypothetical protein
MAMLQFFALFKQKITSVSNTEFCNPIGIKINTLHHLAIKRISNQILVIYPFNLQ